MLTMDWDGLQYQYGKKKKKGKKQKTLTNENYKLGKDFFNASTWEEYENWCKDKKRQEKAQNRSKKKKGKTIKASAKKVHKKPKKVPTRKEQYSQELKHPLWIKKRLAILKRDGYKCRICGSTENLRVHHLKYSNDKKAWEYPNSDLITLCDECHQKVHSDYKHPFYPKYEEIWYNINGFDKYEATEFGRLREKGTKKRVRHNHSVLNSWEYNIDEAYVCITNDNGSEEKLTIRKLIKLLIK